MINSLLVNPLFRFPSTVENVGAVQQLLHVKSYAKEAGAIYRAPSISDSFFLLSVTQAWVALTVGYKSRCMYGNRASMFLTAYSTLDNHTAVIILTPAILLDF